MKVLAIKQNVSYCDIRWVTDAAEDMRGGPRGARRQLSLPRCLHTSSTVLQVMFFTYHQNGQKIKTENKELTVKMQEAAVRGWAGGGCRGSFIPGREGPTAWGECLAGAVCHICHCYEHGQMMMISPFCFWFFSVSRDAHPAVFTTKFIQLICLFSCLIFLQCFLPSSGCCCPLSAPHCHRPPLLAGKLTASHCLMVHCCLPPALIFSSPDCTTQTLCSARPWRGRGCFSAGCFLQTLLRFPLCTHPSSAEPRFVLRLQQWCIHNQAASWLLLRSLKTAGSTKLQSGEDYLGAGSSPELSEKRCLKSWYAIQERYSAIYFPDDSWDTKQPYHAT